MKDVGEHLKQGIEVEGFMRTEPQVRRHILSNDLVPSDFILDDIHALLGGKLFKTPHWDTGYCTEIDLKAWDNLGDLADDFRNVIGEAYDYCNREDLVYNLIGVSPLSAYAGGHIHNSLQGYPGSQKEGCGEIFHALYPVQAFLVLLSQNSPLMRAGRRRYYSLSSIKDGRLEIAGLGIAKKTDTWVGRSYRLAYSDHTTIEVRYPSSASIYQLLAQAVFIKACVFNREALRFVGEHYSDICTLSQMIIEKGAPVGLNLSYGKEQKKISVGRLLYKFINSIRFRDGFKRALSELSVKDQRKVMDVFSIFGTNRSVTDFYHYILKNKGKTIEEQCRLIHKMGEEEIQKGKSIVRSVTLFPVRTLPPTISVRAEDYLMEELFDKKV